MLAASYIGARLYVLKHTRTHLTTYENQVQGVWEVWEDYIHPAQKAYQHCKFGIMASILANLQFRSVHLQNLTQQSTPGPGIDLICGLQDRCMYIQDGPRLCPTWQGGHAQWLWPSGEVMRQATCECISCSCPIFALRLTSSLQCMFLQA